MALNSKYDVVEHGCSLKADLKFLVVGKDLSIQAYSERDASRWGSGTSKKIVILPRCQKGGKTIEH